ncbi:hypothetical protein BGW36DRAFT_356708 [Talaromyces proteolyticus]|uniref:Peptidyl-tRNA hydrolase n=1 Tax=Talaromyces proteolyticus TaxID=1131652 RepID=A0AAD4L2E5_9EURO|nr:uncharacterized protein BGW36DRAFT_356708 [Talaromyces proteolyticus]KAH8702600.1 hypothetical protein BGW36DRAFT_356708 [Talaromyces proteolyticus]
MTSVPLYRCPRRFLFIASIGNPAPYTGTRHSAGHVLLDAIRSPLHERIGLNNPASLSSSSSQSIFYTSWKSPSLMNVSGPPVLEQLKTWLADRQRYFNSTFQTPRQQLQQQQHKKQQQNQPAETENNTPLLRLLKGSQTAEPIDVDIRDMTRFRSTLVILHDELEAQPGKVKVRMGGPAQSSLRGHRGLISIMESLRGAGLLPGQKSSSPQVSILRLGIGIGRPASRERDSVSDYVLSKLTPRDLKALQAAVPGVVDLLVQEMYRGGND